MHEDLISITDGRDSVNFMGALILYRKPGIRAGATCVFEIVDGQQRITTILLYLLSLTKIFSDHGEYEIAARCFEFMVSRARTDNKSNITFYPCNKDRNQFYNIIDKVLSNKKFKEKIDFTPKYLQRTGADTGTLKSQYLRISRLLNKEYDQGGLERVESLFEALVTKFKFVQINLTNPTNANRIYERLNYRGERVTIGDLVRNELFSRISNKESSEIDQIFQDNWVPFYEKFGEDKKFEMYLFSYALILNAGLTKTQVFGHFRDKWRSKDIFEIIECLSKYQMAFLDIVNNKNNLNIDIEVKKKFTDLYYLDVPTTIYPFIIQIAYGVKEGIITSNDAVQILLVVESYLVRRAIVGLEPTGMHAIFKGLWNKVKDELTVENVINAIKSSRTMPWPNNDEFKEMLFTRNIYGSHICGYMLRQYDQNLGGEMPGNKFEIEHVLPQTITDYWSEHFTNDEHITYKNTLANLIPVTKGLNGKCSNKEYLHKRDIYIKDAMFKSTREFGKKYENWNFDSLLKRSEDLIQWAVKRWPY